MDGPRMENAPVNRGTPKIEPATKKVKFPDKRGMRDDHGSTTARASLST